MLCLNAHRAKGGVFSVAKKQR